jgi:hypothetical protein
MRSRKRRCLKYGEASSRHFTVALLRIIFNQSLILAMPNNSESSTRSKFIRWTDDEWARIANHLYSRNRTAQFESPDLGEVKAKDVFLAQHVLPTERHRKLVSIAQGFDGIRARLSTVLQSLPQTIQEDLFQARRLECGDEQHEQGVTGNAHGQATGSARQLQAQSSADEATETIHPGPRAAYDGSVTITADPPQTRRTAELVSEVGEPTVEQMFRSKATREGQPGHRAQKAPAASGTPGPGPAATRLIELARPFIAMVCEEFARALVSVISTQSSRHALQPGTQKAPAQRPASQQAAFNEHQGVARQPSPGTDRANQSQGVVSSDEFLPPYFAAALDEDNADPGEVEVQPLFDPKLPPSADSNFKPNIGLVGSYANDFEDLRQLYPQLHLTIVQANTISDVRRFGHCQRIIALHDEVPPEMDELLGRLLRHRYVRLGGGIDAVKSQLNAWLEAPGSIAVAPRRAVPRNGKELRGEMARKKQNRYPRMIGR